MAIPVEASIAPSLRNDISRHYANLRSRSAANGHGCRVGLFSSLDSLYENLEQCATVAAHMAMQQDYAHDAAKLDISIEQSGRIGSHLPARLNLAKSSAAAPHVQVNWNSFHNRIYHDDGLAYNGPAIDQAIGTEVVRCAELEFLRYAKRVDDAAIRHVQQAWSLWEETRDTIDEPHALRIRSRCWATHDVLRFLLDLKSAGRTDYVMRPRHLDASALRQELREYTPCVLDNIRAAADDRSAFATPYCDCREDHLGLSGQNTLCAHYLGRLMIETMALASGARNGDMKRILGRQKTLGDFFTDYTAAAKELGVRNCGELFPPAFLRRFGSIADELSAPVQKSKAARNDRIILILADQ